MSAPAHTHKGMTRAHLLKVGLRMLLRHGYGDLGIQAILKEANVPKGSFYHHFSSKQDFALAVIDEYMETVHQGLETCLNDESLPPLQRVRRFFELSRDKYIEEGTLGCMLGALGQELSTVDEVFRLKIEACFSEITARIAQCLDLARQRGELEASRNPADVANLILNCWEGAALRSRMWRDADPLTEVLDFCFGALSTDSSCRGQNSDDGGSAANA